MGMISEMLVRHESLAGYDKQSSADEPVERLAAEIVAAAVHDWRSLVRKKAWKDEPKPNCNFTELRNFFKSDWCEFIMQNFEISPARILALLEKELQEAKQQDAETNKRKRKRRTKT